MKRAVNEKGIMRVTSLLFAIVLEISSLCTCKGSCRSFMSVINGDHILLYKCKWQVFATVIPFPIYVQEKYVLKPCLCQ
jgi:hypothetical protein